MTPPVLPPPLSRIAARDHVGMVPYLSWSSALEPHGGAGPCRYGPVSFHGPPSLSLMAARGIVDPRLPHNLNALLIKRLDPKPRLIKRILLPNELLSGPPWWCVRACGVTGAEVSEPIQSTALKGRPSTAARQSFHARLWLESIQGTAGRPGPRRLRAAPTPLARLTHPLGSPRASASLSCGRGGARHR